MNDHDILLDIIKEIEKFKDIDSFENLDDVYNIDLKNNCVSVIKQFLDLLLSYNINKIIENRLKYKIIGTAFMFNWMLSHHIKINLFIKQFPNFRKILNSKLIEYGNDPRIINCKYWKGIDVYKKIFIKLN
jgi:hypothetical protein